MLAITLIMMMMMTTRELAHSSLSLYQRASGPRLSIKKKKEEKKKKSTMWTQTSWITSLKKKKSANVKLTQNSKVISITHLNFLSYVPHVFCQLTALTSL